MTRFAAQSLLKWFENRIDSYPRDTPQTASRKFFPFMWKCTDGIRLYLLCVLLLTSAVGTIDALVSSLLGKLVQWLGNSHPGQSFVAQRDNLVLLVAILIAGPILVAVRAWLQYQTLADAFPMRLRWIFHRRMLNQSLSFFSDEFAGLVTTKVMQTADAVRDVWIGVADMLVYVIAYFVTVASVLAEFDWRLLIPFLLWGGGFGAAVAYFVPRLGWIASRRANARSRVTGLITDAYANISTVKLFSHADREAQLGRSAMQDYMEPARAQSRLVSGIEIATHTLNMMLAGLVGVASLWLWERQHLGVGAVTAAIAMALRLNAISDWLMTGLTALFQNIGIVLNGIDLFARSIEVKDCAGARQLVVSRGEIRYERVQFRYGPRKRVIQDLSLNIRPGEKVGIVGRSGAGKSTLLNLLLRLYDVQGGRILIDGQDIAEVTQESLRAGIGVVTQDTALLHRSVRDNLIYGLPNATTEAMMAAARSAKLDEFIDSLVDTQGRVGYDAHVGERGVRLSGGQRQRIAIARVMLKNAPILFLDEATSALDSQTEAIVQESLSAAMRGKTVIAIAHRLSTIAAMDRLIVLEDGHIVEQGTHAMLLARNGIYARLWAHQSGGFLAAPSLGLKELGK